MNKEQAIKLVDIRDNLGKLNLAVDELEATLYKDDTPPAPILPEVGEIDYKDNGIALCKPSAVSSFMYITHNPKNKDDVTEQQAKSLAVLNREGNAILEFLAYLTRADCGANQCFIKLKANEFYTAIEKGEV